MGFPIPLNAENHLARKIVADVLVGELRIGFTVHLTRRGASVHSRGAADSQPGVEMPRDLAARALVALDLALMERKGLVHLPSGGARPA